MTETNAERILVEICKMHGAGLTLYTWQVDWLIQQAEIVAGAKEWHPEEWHHISGNDYVGLFKAGDVLIVGVTSQPACGNENQGEKK